MMALAPKILSVLVVLPIYIFFALVCLRICIRTEKKEIDER